MHNFLIAASGSFVGIGLLLAFTVIVNIFLEDNDDLDHLTEINDLWLAVIELEEQLGDLQKEFNNVLEVIE